MTGHPFSGNCVHVIGGGLAGSEAAWQLARARIPVTLHEMRPHRQTDVHQTGDCAELVCSNSFRSDDATTNAVGVLHEEMRQAGSLIMKAADQNRLPAGSALAVDRTGFARTITKTLEDNPLITINREEIARLPLEGDPEGMPVIVATGPLTSPGLAEALQTLTGTEHLAFFDAIAPVVYRDSLDMDICWMQSRYDKSATGGTGADYINCPLTQGEYTQFTDALLQSDTVSFHDWERNTPYFEGCLPVEVMAARGPETLRHGPMKPVGLTNRHKPDERPYAVVQLRQDNAAATLYNIVGFQTKLRHGEQQRVFRMVPGLATARFARFGGLHRNTFLNSPRLLDGLLRLKTHPAIRFAGQITGVEGYVESAATGLLAGRFVAAGQRREKPCPPPPETALGALLGYITHAAHADNFQPMNINFGLFPELTPDGDGNPRKKQRRRDKRQALATRALRACAHWLEHQEQALETMTQGSP